MQADQTVLSLRPGGGSRGGNRVLGPRFESLAFGSSSNLPVFHPHGGTPPYFSLKLQFKRFGSVASALIPLQLSFYYTDSGHDSLNHIIYSFERISPIWGNIRLQLDYPSSTLNVLICDFHNEGTISFLICDFHNEGVISPFAIEKDDRYCSYFE